MSVVIDAQLVKTLREKTNAGLMECKRALGESQGDLEAAVDILRKKGVAKASGKADREAKEGVIAQSITAGAKVGVLLEVNCETDFVAKNDSFKAFCDDLARKFAADADANVEDDRVTAVQKLGENIRIRRHSRIEVQGNGLVAAYIHTGGKVGVLVEVSAEQEATSASEEFKQLVRDITLHIAAANPICVSRDEVPSALVERERDVQRGTVPAGKPANIIEQIVEGKMRRFYSEKCLLEQEFIKNPDQTITQLIAEKSKALGDNIVLRRFIRYMVGEELASAEAPAPEVAA